MPFLNMSPSPLLSGMGQVGTALPNEEAYGFYYNPAHLGQFDQKIHGVFQFYPAKTSGSAFILKGIFKLISSSSSNNVVTYIGKHFDLQYTYSEIDAGDDHPITGTEFQSISLIYYQ